jgi:ethanolamine utilization protein EutN
MFFAKVVGSMISTQKVATMTGHKLMLVEPYKVDPATKNRLIGTGRSFVAVDTLGSGVGDMVLVTQGSSARLTPETKNLPIDAVIVGLIDQVSVEQGCVYDRKSD